MAIESRNPATGEILRTYSEMPTNRVEAAIEQAETRFQEWRDVAFSERAHCMRRAAGVLRQHQEDYARLMALEMGKPVKEGRAEIEKCALTCEYYANHAERFLTPESIDTEAGKSYVAYEPLGVVLAVMPWNFPFWQVFRFAAPGLREAQLLVERPRSRQVLDSQAHGESAEIHLIPFVRRAFPHGTRPTKNHAHDAGGGGYRYP